MSTLAFKILDCSPARFAAVPTMNFRLRLEDVSGETLESIALRCQIRIEPHRRRYSAAEAVRLLELFGETPRWGDTLKPFLWTHVTHIVPAFSGSIDLDLPVACSYDMEVAAAKYFHSLEGGEIPLIFLFSGTIFGRGEAGLSVTQVSWSCEASFRMPARAWRDLMDHYFPDAGWLRLRRDTLDALMRFKATRALASWDAVVETLLKEFDTEDARGELALPGPRGDA